MCNLVSRTLFTRNQHHCLIHSVLRNVFFFPDVWVYLFMSWKKPELKPVVAAAAAAAGVLNNTSLLTDRR